MTRRTILTLIGGLPVLFRAGAGSAMAAGPDIWTSFYQPSDTFADLDKLPEKGTFVYTVRQSTTIEEVAERILGDASLGPAVARWNDLRRPRLRAGQTIKLPLPRLALLYTLEALTKPANGFDLEPVDDDHKFRPGERFRLRISANRNGYLYAFNRDAEGYWRRLYPADLADGPAEKFTEYLMPGDGWFTLDKKEGKEELFLLLSLEPIDDLEPLFETPAGKTIPEDQEKIVESLLEREKSVRKGISRVEPGGPKWERGAVVALDPESGLPLLAYRLKLRREE
jgi:hypothetical protein